MNTKFQHAFLAFATLAFVLTSTVHAEDKKAETKEKKKSKPVKTKDVEVGGLKLKLPENWVTEKSSSSMRLATYTIKPVEGEKDKAEVTIFKFPTQSVKGNIDRWAGQFAADGRKSKTTKGKCATGEYYMFEGSGTFKKPKPGSPPFLRQTINAKDYRMLGVILPKGSSMYFVKMAGPNKTVAAQAKAFRAAFGGEKKTEKEHKFE